ncbi:MAG: hypothetical protein KGV51_03005 [Moraxellaceae bacterium]|nr:hypothetical protein [Moraxellaceae bacterium]
MKKIVVCSLIALGLSTQVAHAMQASVQYDCQSNKSVKVTYQFNQQGLPTSAQAVVNGRNHYMPINLGRSDNTGTVFGRDGQYVLSSGYLDSKNYKKSSILLTSPSNKILFKNCSARKSTVLNRQSKLKSYNTSVGKVRYQCQSGKSLQVHYSFNNVGLPTSAKAYVNGRVRYMPINLSRSDNSGTVFGKNGQYVLSSGYLTKKNFKKSSMLLTSPNNEILFKNCKGQ